MKQSAYHAMRATFLPSEHGAGEWNWNNILTSWASKEGGPNEWSKLKNFALESYQTFATVGAGQLYFGINKADKVTPLFSQPSLHALVKEWVPDGTLCQGISVTFIHNSNYEGILELLTRNDWLKSFDLRADGAELRHEDVAADILLLKSD